MLGTVLGTGDSAVNETTVVPSLMQTVRSLPFCWEEADIGQVNL